MIGAHIYNNLGAIFTQQGNYKAAEDTLIKAHRIYKRKLHRYHPEFISNQYSFAILYRMQEKYKQAAPYYKKVHMAYLNTLGNKHPKTIEVFKEVVYVYGKLK